MDRSEIIKYCEEQLGVSLTHATRRLRECNVIDADSSIVDFACALLCFAMSDFPAKQAKQGYSWVAQLPLVEVLILYDNRMVSTATGDGITGLPSTIKDLLPWVAARDPDEVQVDRILVGGGPGRREAHAYLKCNSERLRLPLPAPGLMAPTIGISGARLVYNHGPAVHDDKPHKLMHYKAVGGEFLRELAAQLTPPAELAVIERTESLMQEQA